MQVVIEIDEKLYNYMQTEEYDKHLDKRFDYQIRFAVKDGTPLPKGATNGDVIKTMFPNVSNSNLDLVDVLKNAKNWWNAPYQREENK